jgi:hypothetical protein
MSKNSRSEPLITTIEDKGTPRAPEKGKVHTMFLPVELKGEEVAARAKQLTALIREKGEAADKLEAHIKAAKGAKESFESDIDDLDSRIRSLSIVVANEREDRHVEVYDELDFAGGIVFTKRSDTQAVVASRGMTEAERQRALFKPADKAVKDALDQVLPVGATMQLPTSQESSVESVTITRER